MKNPFKFLYDIFRTGKIREFTSFIIWEAFHQLRLFPKKQYLNFNDTEPIVLDKVNVKGNDFHNEVLQFFESREIKIHRNEKNWGRLLIAGNGELYGSSYDDDRELYKIADDGKTVTLLNKFPERIKSMFISSQGILFVCVKGSVYRSLNKGETFTKTLNMDTSESFFRHNNAMTETPNKDLIVGEYGNVWEKGSWRKIAYIYFSYDAGETWTRSDFLIKKGTNKHVHIVKYSRLLNKVFVASGDNKKKLWISDSVTSVDRQKLKWNLVNKFHIQVGGYTSVVENDAIVLFGTDYQGGTNFLVETTDGKKYNKKIIPDPYRRSPIYNMALRNSKAGNEIWADLSFSIGKSKCLMMYTSDNGKNWSRVFEYEKTKYAVKLISAASGISDELYLSVKDLKNNDRVVYKIG